MSKGHSVIILDINILLAGELNGKKKKNKGTSVSKHR